MDLPAFADRLRDWLSTKDTWRTPVTNWALGMVEDRPVRAMTRDIDWGVDVPVDDLGPGKKIYVWFDAVIGYLSASIEWASMTDDPDAWEKWWKDPEAESYYIVGKDNIPFHTVIWPAMLMGHGGLNLPTDVPANQYITFKGQKASKSKGVGNSIGFYAGRLQPDALRYAIAAILPEQNDSDGATHDQGQRRQTEPVDEHVGNDKYGAEQCDATGYGSGPTPVHRVTAEGRACRAGPGHEALSLLLGDEIEPRTGTSRYCSAWR